MIQRPADIHLPAGHRAKCHPNMPYCTVLQRGRVRCSAPGVDLPFARRQHGETERLVGRRVVPRERDHLPCCNMPACAATFSGAAKARGPRTACMCAIHRPAAHSERDHHRALPAGANPSQPPVELGMLVARVDGSGRMAALWRSRFCSTKSAPLWRGCALRFRRFLRRAGLADCLGRLQCLQLLHLPQPCGVADKLPVPPPFPSLSPACLPWALAGPQPSATNQTWCVACVGEKELEALERLLECEALEAVGD